MQRDGSCIARWDDPNAVLGVLTDQAYSLILPAEFEAVVTTWAETLAAALEFLRLQLTLVLLTEVIERGVEVLLVRRDPLLRAR